MQGAQLQSLVRKERSHMLCTAAKGKKINKETRIEINHLGEMLEIPDANLASDAKREKSTHMYPQHTSPTHCAWLWLSSNGKAWGYTDSLSVVTGAVNLESIYLEWLNQCSKCLLNIKYVSDHWDTCQCRRHKRCRLDPWVGEIPWSRRWQPTPACLPGQSQGRRSMVGYSP